MVRYLPHHSTGHAGPDLPLAMIPPTLRPHWISNPQWQIPRWERWAVASVFRVSWFARHAWYV